MKRNSNGFIWGIILIVLGLFIAGKAFGLLKFTIFFDGWWTLFIIIPCFIGLFSNENGKISYLVGLCIGVLLLMSAQNMITWRMFGPLLFAVVLVLAGISILFKKDPSEDHNQYTEYRNGNDSNQSGEYKEYKSNHGTNSDANNDSTNSSYEYTYSTNENNTTGESGTQNNTHHRTYYSNSNNNSYQNSYSKTGYCACTAVFAGKDIRFDNKEFHGAVLSTVFGGIELDLRNAIINENVVIDAKAILGGIDIYVPNYVRVSIDCTPILGGVDDKTRTPMGANENTPTIFINATCVLGGIDVK